jgi:hypothetical protein
MFDGEATRGSYPALRRDDDTTRPADGKTRRDDR